MKTHEMSQFQFWRSPTNSCLNNIILFNNVGILQTNIISSTPFIPHHKERAITLIDHYNACSDRWSKSAKMRVSEFWLAKSSCMGRIMTTVSINVLMGSKVGYFLTCIKMGSKVGYFLTCIKVKIMMRKLARPRLSLDKINLFTTQLG